MSMSEGLRGRIALATGGSSGLGRATALALAGASADVAVLARGSADLERTAEQIRARAVQERLSLCSAREGREDVAERLGQRVRLLEKC